MTTFPMLRVSRSNEHMLADVFKILVLYHIPVWIEDPFGILRFILLITVGGMIDFLFSLIRYKKLWCCASGSVTAAIISLLAVGAPIWGQLLGIVIALIIGKHLWGGTGKNLLNPALVGLIPVMLIFDLSLPQFSRSWFYLPAILLGLFMVRVRPFAAFGIIVGMLAGLSINHELTVWSIITYGVFFWGSMIITDPVTVTANRVAGIAAGFLAGFGGMIFEPVPIALPIAILLVNLFSAVIEGSAERSRDGQKARITIPKAIEAKNYSKKLIDLEGTAESVPIPEDEIAKLSKEDILRRIKESEMFGMGGAAFPTGRKLQTLGASKEEKYFIINGVECDPGLMHDAWLLRNYSKEIQNGIALIARCAEFKSIYLAAKDIMGLSYPDYIKLHQVRDLYPMGAERILISEILGKKLTNDQIPASQGILVLNVQTVYAIYRAVYLNEVVDTRILTVADLKDKTAEIVRVKLGRKLREVVQSVYPDAVNIFVGGGMMQAYLAEDEAVVDQSVNFIATGNYPSYKESPQCSKCGNCIKSCPSGLKVNLIADLVDQGKPEEAEKFYVNECISCGSCSYSCPAGRNLAARVKVAKNAV
jgi:Na+-translocating ferredoxin:NAD+ oxidoreductase RnfD subunit/ferredoxin